MPNASIYRNDVHPLAGSPLIEYPLEEHVFTAGVTDPEKCAICNRNRAMHSESDTVSPFYINQPKRSLTGRKRPVRAEAPTLKQLFE
jgi:hypothetical protein